MQVTLAILQILFLIGFFAFSCFYIDKHGVLIKFINKLTARKLKKAEEKVRAAVPVTQQVDPILVYKRALVLNTGELAGIGYHDRYKPWDKAICRMGKKHEKTPSVTCTCGFWGLPTAEAAGAVICMQTVALLQVEFFGEIIRFEKGYRAEKQRILSINFTDNCRGCLNGEVDRLISITPGITFSNIKSLTWKLVNSGYTIACSIDADSPLMPFCADCISILKQFPEDLVEIKEWTLADVANTFQVEVNWWKKPPTMSEISFFTGNTPFTPRLRVFYNPTHLSNPINIFPKG